MEAVDEYFPDPKRVLDKPFLMPIEDVFSIQGHGAVSTRRIEEATIKVGEDVEILGLKEGPPTKSIVAGVEMFKKILDQGLAKDVQGHGPLKLKEGYIDPYLDQGIQEFSS
jgi:elongation factor Tu